MVPNNTKTRDATNAKRDASPINVPIGTLSKTGPRVSGMIQSLQHNKRVHASIQTFGNGHV